jgi:two-component system, cell cycle sensor histidine kinase and response regulator CckA
MRACGSPFDLVILDMTIPGGKGGKEVIGRLREIEPGVRALISTGYALDEIVENYGKHGFNGILTKPFTSAQLRQVFWKVWDQAG